jgi:hypothetical protein
MLVRVLGFTGGCIRTFGVCDLTLPARASEPWTFPMIAVCVGCVVVGCEKVSGWQELLVLSVSERILAVVVSCSSEEQEGGGIDGNSRFGDGFNVAVFKLGVVVDGAVKLECTTPLKISWHSSRSAHVTLHFQPRRH